LNIVVVNFVHNQESGRLPGVRQLVGALVFLPKR
jgi:hypothetical protein